MLQHSREHITKTDNERQSKRGKKKIDKIGMFERERPAIESKREGRRRGPKVGRGEF